jgi:hypothetical protein
MIESANELVFRGSAFDPELLHPELEGAAVNTQDPRRPSRTREYPTRLLQRCQDLRALGLFSVASG